MESEIIRKTIVLKPEIEKELKPILERLERPFTWAANEGLKLFIEREKMGAINDNNSK